MDSSVSTASSVQLNSNKKRLFSELEMENNGDKTDYENEPNQKKQRVLFDDDNMQKYVSSDDNKDSDIDINQSAVNDKDIQDTKLQNKMDNDVSLMYELSDDEESEDDLHNYYSIDHLKCKYSKQNYITIADYLKTPVSISNKTKPYMIAKLIYKNKSSLNLAPHKCIFEDKSGKIEVYIYLNTAIRMDNLILNEWYFLADFHGKVTLPSHVRYLKLAQLVILQIRSTSVVQEVLLDGKHAENDFLKEVVDQTSMVKNNGTSVRINRSIKYYTQHKKTSVECLIDYDIVKDICYFKKTRNISGRLLSVEIKKTNDYALYFHCEIADGTDYLKMNIFNVFKQDYVLFEKLMKAKGVIGCFNFNMKIKDGVKIFSLGNQGFYKLDVINPVNSIDVLTNLDNKSVSHTSLQTNSSLIEVKKILNNKKTLHSEWFNVEAKIDEVQFPFSNIPFKFWLKKYNIYGLYDVETFKITNDKNNLVKTVADDDVEVKFNVTVQLWDDVIFKNLSLSKKAVYQLYPTLKGLDVKQSYYLWLENNHDFEKQFQENIDKWFKFKINIFYYCNRYRVMIHGLELMDQ